MQIFRLLDLMIEDCTKEYESSVIDLVNYALDRGCGPEDLYRIFGEDMVNALL